MRALADPGVAENAALAATLFCAWACALLTFRVPRSTPRLFLALALFGLNWGVLLLYYLPGPPQNEILAAFSGYLLVYVGVLLLREARGPETRESPGDGIGWPDRLPLWLFRPTVGGFGLYLLARRLFHFEYGYGTLALALWGTLLTVLGYGVIWAALTAFYAGSRSVRRIRTWLALLLGVYSFCEVYYTGWYARHYWPLYHRYLRLEMSRNAPDLETPLPFEPRPDWPDPSRWKALLARPDRPAFAPTLSLKVEPRLPDMPPWLKNSFSLLKVLFVGAFFWLICRRPDSVRSIFAVWPF